MKKKILPIAVASSAFLLLSVGSLDAHDLFLRPVSFFSSPGKPLMVRLLNGTFNRSESAVTQNRLRDLSLASPSGRKALDPSSWTAVGDTSSFTITTAEPGTYVVGASTLPRIIRLSGAQFTEYLRSDGLPDVLQARRISGTLGDSAAERYSKHVKAVIQVGSKKSAGFDFVFGYPAELVPLNNPYALKRSGRLRVKALVDGQPSIHQLVLFGGRTERGQNIAEDSVRTDASGVASLRLHLPGAWYVKFISMARMANDSVDYESKWATLTFQLR